MIREEVTMNIRGNKYPVQFPTVGKFYQIEATKQSLSRGYYNVMVSSPSRAAQHALDMIDIEAVLVVVCPKLIEDLKVKNFGDLDVLDYKEIRDEYTKVVAPLFKEINDLLNTEDNDVTK